MCVRSDSLDLTTTSTIATCKTHDQEIDSLKKKHKGNVPNQIKISLTVTAAAGESEDHHLQKSLPRLNLSPIYLHPPVEVCALGAAHRANSFNCLTATGKVDNNRESASMKKYPPTSLSDSHLETNSNPQPKNIFNFCNDLILNPNVEPSVVCSNRRPPLSPYRARSPSPFPSSMDTPPSSPLTPVGVLYNLPSFLLSPILHWLYTESLLPDLEEDVCEKLINFSETQPSLTKMIEPCKKYLKLIRLKKCKFFLNIFISFNEIVF